MICIRGKASSHSIFVSHESSKKARFYIHHQTGSHIQLRHRADSKTRITIPFKKKDLSPKTLKSILKQAGLTVEEFLKLL